MVFLITGLMSAWLFMAQRLLTFTQNSTFPVCPELNNLIQEFESRPKLLNYLLVDSFQLAP